MWSFSTTCRRNFSPWPNPSVYGTAECLAVINPLLYDSQFKLLQEKNMYRPDIKVVDCTIRDGGLANNSYFTLETVRAVYKAICDSGIDYVELGYRNSKKMFSPDKYGPWRFCDEDVLRQATDG